MQSFYHAPAFRLLVVFLTTLSLLSSSLVQAAKLPDGLEVQVTTPKKCKRPTRDGDTLEIHYKGTLSDGTVFDSSYERGKPFSFTLGYHHVINGWEFGLQTMCVGEARKLVIAPELAYGNRAMGPIPAGSTLIFETLLMGIKGVEPEEDTPSTNRPSKGQSAAEGSSKPDAEQSTESGSKSQSAPEEDTLKEEAPPAEMLDEVTPQKGGVSAGHTTSSSKSPGAENGECQLLGPFALFVQAGLGLLAVLSLVFKRWRERPQRPVKIWFFDVSKQVFGAALLHVFNVLMSTISAGEYSITGTADGHSAGGPPKGGPDGHAPNPCSLYLINIAVDTTLGVVLLVMILKVLHHAASLTPIANPPESIRSGYYGQPPRAAWWLKQSIIYFIGLLLMKLCVFFIFELVPQIAQIGDWALRWTQGSQPLQITFVMFIFPLIMNAIQYVLIDSFIKDNQSVQLQDGPADDGDEESRQRLHDPERDSDEYITSRDSEDNKHDQRVAVAEAASSPGGLIRKTSHSGSSPVGGSKGKDKSKSS